MNTKGCLNGEWTNDGLYRQLIQEVFSVQLPVRSFRPMSWLARLIAIVLIVAFLIVGIAGLILPIIPGVLFLFLAALLLTRVSRRAAEVAHRQPWFREQLHAWQASGGLSVGQRLRLSLLLTVRALIGGIAAGGRVVRKALAR